MRMRSLSSLTEEVLVREWTTVKDMRAGLLRMTGGSICSDEAIIVNAKGEIFDEPWATPFQDVSEDGEEVFTVIVRRAQTSYYRDMADRCS